VDRAVFRPLDRPVKAPGFRFGTSGRRSHGGIRKGHEDVIRAFLEEFRPHESATLCLKLWPDCLDAAPALKVPADPRITVITDPMSLTDLAGWYRGNDCYVSGSWGEGFGLQPLESLACGVPVIATRYSGHTEYFDESVGWPLRYSMEPGIGGYANAGHLARPVIGSLRDQMRAAFEDREGRIARGRAGVERSREFSWWLMGRRYADVLIRWGYLKPKPPVGPHTSAINRVRECPHIVPRNCGCENLKCGAGHGNKDGEVTPDQCIACVGGLQ
jgi:glycosyltransferase involved in cell wall biosynthesis